MVGMGMNHREIAEKLDCSRGAISLAIKKLRETAPELLALQSVEDFRKNETVDLAGLRQVVLGALRRKLNTTSLAAISIQQLATLYGIMFDKDRLLRGESTEHIATASYAELDSKTRETIADAVKQITCNMISESQKELAKEMEQEEAIDVSDYTESNV